MDIVGIPFETFDLAGLEPEPKSGASGSATWRTVTRGNVRIRIVEYSPGYLADHWCEKGHAVYVLEGEFESELKDGRRSRLTPGMCYLVADGAEPHRSSTATGVKLLIVD